MRLWSVHPNLLDRQGLLGLWREGLLALKILEGKTTAYYNHPQLERFKLTIDPAGFVAEYLEYVMVEGHKRGYHFDPGLVDHMVGRVDMSKTMIVHTKQLEFEVAHLYKKLLVRDPERASKIVLPKVESRFQVLTTPQLKDLVHPMFVIVDGDIEPWEKSNGEKRIQRSASV